jgi:hypothetical protein
MYYRYNFITTTVGSAAATDNVHCIARSCVLYFAATSVVSGAAAAHTAAFRLCCRVAVCAAVLNLRQSHPAVDAALTLRVLLSSTANTYFTELYILIHYAHSKARHT